MTCSAKFWSKLHDANGPNTMGIIQLILGFEGVPEGASKLAQGPVDCCATKYNGGYQLSPLDQACQDSVRLYWLPWKDKLVASAKRADYEGTCDYFMTAKLEGCRFALTSEEVVHVASNVGGALSTGTGSGLRTMSEEKRTKGAESRRLSISSASLDDGNFTYGTDKGGGTSIVLGMKRNNVWTYKALIVATDTWISFIDF